MYIARVVEAVIWRGTYIRVGYPPSPCCAYMTEQNNVYILYTKLGMVFALLGFVGIIYTLLFLLSSAKSRSTGRRYVLPSMNSTVHRPCRYASNASHMTSADLTSPESQRLSALRWMRYAVKSITLFISVSSAKRLPLLGWGIN